MLFYILHLTSENHWCVQLFCFIISHWGETENKDQFILIMMSAELHNEFLLQKERLWDCDSLKNLRFLLWADRGWERKKEKWRKKKIWKKKKRRERDITDWVLHLFMIGEDMVLTVKYKENFKSEDDWWTV